MSAPEGFQSRSLHPSIPAGAELSRVSSYGMHRDPEELDLAFWDKRRKTQVWDFHSYQSRLHSTFWIGAPGVLVEHVLQYACPEGHRALLLCKLGLCATRFFCSAAFSSITCCNENF